MRARSVAVVNKALWRRKIRTSTGHTGYRVSCDERSVHGSEAKDMACDWLSRVRCDAMDSFE
jgi:hypothetical protein